MIVFVVVSLPLSWLAVRLHHAREQAQIVEAIERGGGHVGYDNLSPDGSGPMSSLSEKVFGKDFAWRVVSV